MKSSVKVKDSGKTVCPNSVRWCEFSFPSFPLTDLKSIVGTPFAYSGKINGEVICLFSITRILSTYFEIFSPGMMFLAFTSVQISIVGCVCKMTARSQLTAIFCAKFSDYSLLFNSRSSPCSCIITLSTFP